MFESFKIKVVQQNNELEDKLNEVQSMLATQDYNMECMEERIIQSMRESEEYIISAITNELNR